MSKSRYLNPLFLTTWILSCLSSSAQSWENITGNVPGDVTSINYGPMATDGTRLYILGAQGVFVSSDGGNTFSALNTVNSATYGLNQSNLRFIEFANGEMWEMGSAQGRITPRVGLGGIWM